MKKKKERYHLLDSMRGVMLVQMIVYHLLYDLVYIFGVEIAWFDARPGYVWQQFVCWSFIFISGMCWAIGSRPLKRGMFVFGMGIVLTLVTLIFMPSERVVFGILTFMGSAMIIVYFLNPVLKKCNPGAGFGIAAVLFLLFRGVNAGYLGFEQVRIWGLPETLYRNYLTAYLGFAPDSFWSSDYFSVLPWIFLYICGYFFWKIIEKREDIQKVLYKRLPVFDWIGENSIWIYLVHQPIIYAVLLLIFM